MTGLALVVVGAVVAGTLFAVDLLRQDDDLAEFGGDDDDAVAVVVGDCEVVPAVVAFALAADWGDYDILDDRHLMGFLQIVAAARRPHNTAAAAVGQQAAVVDRHGDAAEAPAQPLAGAFEPEAAAVAFVVAPEASAVVYAQSCGFVLLLVTNLRQLDAADYMYIA